jgi:signal transduction histidine kinase
LGLSIVQRIAELHSASISVENRRPSGARFSLKFATVKPRAQGRTFGHSDPNSPAPA